MANKVYNMEGGLHSAQAFSAFENAMYGSCVADIDSYKATAGTGMNVTLSTGNGLISTGTGFARRIASDATNTVAITASSTANPRKDVVVAYIDNGVTPTTTVVDNTNNILKFKSVAGTPAASPVAPTASAIQTSVGAGNPYMILWEITVPKSATSLTGATFTDKRNIANIITGDDLDDGTITPSKLKYSDMVKYAVLQDTAQVAANTAVLSITVPAGTWKITSSLRAYAVGGNQVCTFVHCGQSAAINEVGDNNTLRIHHTFVDVVKPTTSTTYSYSCDKALSYNGQQNIMIAERIG